MSAHTPGPFRFDGEHVIGPDGRMVCKVPRLQLEARANGLLFSVAPELLEKLKRAGRELALLGKGRPSIESLVDEIGDLVAHIEGAK